MQALTAIAQPCDAPERSALGPLIEVLIERHGEALAAVIYYGSCLRKSDPYAGLVDFYVIVDGLRAARLGRIATAAGHLLPPNVYYLETAGPSGVLRCKYALITRGQLERGARDWFSPGIWGRFAQPVAIVHTRDSGADTAVYRCLDQSVVTLLDNALPALADSLATPAELFAAALALSFNTELRVETRERAAALIAMRRRDYTRCFERARPRLKTPITDRGDNRCQIDVGRDRARRARLAWRLRTLQGRALSILRLTKACFTFTDAIDYGAWKLERHTGIKIGVTPRMRRHPIIFGAVALVRVLHRRRRKRLG